MGLGAGAVVFPQSFVNGVAQRGARTRAAFVSVLLASLVAAFHFPAAIGVPADATETPTTKVTGVVVSPYGGSELAQRARVTPAWVLLLAWQEGHGWIDYRHPESRLEVLTDSDGSFSLDVPTVLLDGRPAALMIAPSPELAATPDPLGVAIVPIALPTAPDAEVALGLVELPAPDVIGRLLDIPARDGAGLAQQSVFVQSVDSSSTVQGSWTSSTGHFAFAVSGPDITGGLIRILTDFSSPDRIGFEVPISAFIAADGVLDVQFPQPNVAGTLTAGGVKVDGEWLYLERRLYAEFDSWTSVGFARTDTEGRFWFAQDLSEPGPYRLRLPSVTNDEGAFPAFDVPVVPPESGEVLELEVVYPEPNVTGTLIATAGDPKTSVASGNIALHEIIDHGDWVQERWLNRTATTDALGRFSFFLSDAQIAGVVAGTTRIEMRVRPPYSRRGELPPFTVRLDQLLGADATASDLQGLQLAFPTANVTGVLLDAPGGAPIENSWVVVQRRVQEYGEVRWDWTSFGTSTAEDGAFAFFLPELGSGGWRLRFQVTDGTGSLRFTVPLASPSTGLTVAVPAPNLSGTVRGASGTPVPNASVELRRFVSGSGAGDGYWSWTGISTSADSSGQFAFVLSPEELAGTLQLRVSPPSALRGSVSTFSFPLPASGSLVGLAVDAPQPDLTGTLTSPDGVAVSGAQVSLQREITIDGGTYWDWVDAWATTSAAGGFALTVDDPVADARYRLAVQPPWNRRSELVMFSAPVQSIGPGSTLTLSFPAPNVAGVVLDPDGAPVRQAWLSLQAWDEQAGFWDHVAGASTNDSGAFVMFTDAPGPHRINVSGYLGTGGYSELTTRIDVTDPGSASLELQFPTPNLVTRLVDGTGSGLWRAWVWVERLLEDGELDFSALEGVGIGGSSDREGEVGLRIEQPGAYRLHISAPWGRSLPTFSVDFEVADDLSVTGIPEVLPFPEPNLVIDVQGPLTSGTVPLRDALIEVRIVDPVDGVARYTNLYSQTDRDGRAALRLDPGTYRIYVHPPWYGQQLGFAELEVTIVDGGGRLDEAVTLRSPNVLGSVQVTSGVSASWSWIEVERLAPTPSVALPGVHTRRDGTFATGLSDGTYLLRVWSSHARASSGPLEAIVTIESDAVASWRYSVESDGTDNCADGEDPCLVALSFDDSAVQPNVAGLVSRGGVNGEPVSNTFLVLSATGPGTSGTPATWSVTVVTGPDGTFSLLAPTDIEISIAIVLERGMTVERVAVPGTFSAGDVEIAIDVDALVAAG